MSAPRLLDLFCGAGGAGMGYSRAGFDVTGVDHVKQPRYPFRFIQADALNPPVRLEDFDVIHASPPCQAYTTMRALGRGVGKGAPELIEPVRVMLRASGRPYIIENVVGAPLENSVVLCGSMFGLPLRRHRLFESNILMLRTWCNHQPNAIAVYGDHPEDAFIHRRDLVSAGATKRAATLEIGQDAMGIDWMPWRELTQAIPPAFTHHLGAQLMDFLSAQDSSQPKD